MRILSQDGKIDLPYENFSLSITQDNCIVAARDVVARPTEMLIGVVAEYSTEAKARKAMEMLRYKYTGISDGYKDEDGVLYRERRSTDNFCFQFPADDEVEV